MKMQLLQQLQSYAALSHSTALQKSVDYLQENISCLQTRQGCFSTLAQPNLESVPLTSAVSS